MTQSQRISLQSRWWPTAARAQGWAVSDRALRLRVCSWAVSLKDPDQHALLAAIASGDAPTRELSSTSDLNSTSDIDRLKSALGMLAGNITLTNEVGHPEIGDGRRKRELIRDHLRCLALYHAAPESLLENLIQDMFGRGSNTAAILLEDLNDFPQI